MQDNGTILMVLLLLGIVVLIALAAVYLKRRRGSERESQTLLLHINDSLDDIMSRVDNLETRNRSAEMPVAQEPIREAVHSDADEFWSRFGSDEPQVRTGEAAVGFGVPGNTQQDAQSNQDFWDEFNRPLKDPGRHDRATQTTLTPRSDRPKRLGRQTLVPQGEEQEQMQEAVRRATIQHTMQQAQFAAAQRQVRPAPQFEQMRNPEVSRQTQAQMAAQRGQIQRPPQQTMQMPRYTETQMQRPQGQQMQRPQGQPTGQPVQGQQRPVQQPSFQQPTFQQAPQRPAAPPQQRAAAPQKAVPYQTMVMQRSAQGQPQYAQQAQQQRYMTQQYVPQQAQSHQQTQPQPVQQAPQMQPQAYRQAAQPERQQVAESRFPAPDQLPKAEPKPQYRQMEQHPGFVGGNKFEDRNSGQDRQGRVYSVEELRQQIK